MVSENRGTEALAREQPAKRIAVGARRPRRAPAPGRSFSKRARSRNRRGRGGAVAVETAERPNRKALGGRSSGTAPASLTSRAKRIPPRGRRPPPPRRRE